MARIAFAVFALLIASSYTEGRRPSKRQARDVESVPEPDAGPIVEPSPLSECYQMGNILLMQWVPFPIDKYLYIALNTSDNSYPTEEGELKIAEFTKARFPDVGLIFSVVPGDADFIYTTLDVPIISIDALKTDHFFMNYLDVLYNMHNFFSHVELWAHLIEFQEAFWPVRDRVSAVFQPYLEEKMKAKQQKDGSNGGSGAEDFVGQDPKPRPGHSRRPHIRRK